MAQAEQYLSQAKDIINKDKRELLMRTSEKSVNGAVIGLIFGMMIGYYKKRNVYISGLVGGIAGGVLGNVVARKLD